MKTALKSRLTHKNSTWKICNKVRLKSYSGYSTVLLLILILQSYYVQLVNCNHPPKFQLNASEIVVRLKEGPGSPIGTLIYKLRALDVDGDDLMFGVRPAIDSNVIRLKKTSKTEANLYLDTLLDRETKNEYQFILTLTDHRLGEGNFVTQSLLLIVDDINDNAPVFKPFQSTIEVPENSKPGILTTVEAFDEDEGSYGQVVYYIQELEGDGDAFSISTVEGLGTIKLTKSLDYEEKNFYQLKILAVDRANQGPIHTSTATLLVRVKDEEDSPPEFVFATPVQRVSEGTPKGTQILMVKAVDGDRGVNNKIQYAITRGGGGIFKINEDTGAIYNIKELDREEPDNLLNGGFILEIVATERTFIKPPPLVRTEVTIIIMDINDLKPTFKALSYNCEIYENSQENTPLTFIGNSLNEVSDLDQGNNGTFELFLKPPTYIFEITPKKVINEAKFLIRVKNPAMLDYEKHHFFNFTIVAREIVKNGEESTASLSVLIRDRNDEYPHFTSSLYNVDLPENIRIGTSIAKIEAFDADSGDFGTKGIRYTNITGSIAHLLHLDLFSGIITLLALDNDAFDRERNSKHYLVIEACDNLGKGNQNTVQLILNIQDLNDNPPRFVHQRYEARLLEGSMEFESPLIIEARDADLAGTPNSNITYMIWDGDYRKNFSIDPITGQMYLYKSIDFELLSGSDSNIRLIYLTVIAQDAGTPKMISKVPVIIYVHDINDNAPHLEKSLYEIAVQEDVLPGTPIIRLTAHDNDGAAPNNLIVYRIQDGAKDKFTIGANTGIVTVALGASLDPDLTEPKQWYHSLTVIALDGGIGDHQLNATCIVNISVVDVNNKKPVLYEPHSIKIKENTHVGTKVYKLLATDMDTNPKLRYYIDGNSSEARTEDNLIVKRNDYDFVSAFELNPIDGLIKMTKILDRERVESIKLAVFVEDIAAQKGLQISKQNVNIIIEDENDNEPIFQKPFYKKSVVENSPIGVAIMKVYAFDADKNKTIRYTIEGLKEITQLIHIHPETGEIVVANKIDHETFQWLNFTVRASDFGVPRRSSMVECFIKILDENDNNPFFISDVQNFTVYENSPIGTRIAMIKANDLDSGEYGKITFLMDRISSHGKFSIDADMGLLVVAESIDRERKDLYMVVIEIWDNYQFGYLNGESRNAFKQIYITVLDENDSPPTVNVPRSCIHLTEFHKIDETIFTLKGSDDDDPQLLNGQIEYEIFDDNGLDLFMLDKISPWTANIYAKRSLIGYFGNHTITLLTRDLGKPQNVVKNALTICIADFNDHAPIFISPANNFTVRIPENATLGTQLIQVKAIDDDIGPNAAIKYRLKHDVMGDYRTFSIDEFTGIITLRAPLDREKQKLYELRVEAYDQGIPTSLSSDLDLTIYVRNINDYEPQFLVDEIFINFTEQLKPGIERKQLPDTVDRDEVDDLDDPASVVCYFIVYGNERNIFHLEPITHVLSTNKELDRELQDMHILIVKASEDCNNPPQQLMVEQQLQIPLNDTDVFVDNLNIVLTHGSKKNFNQYDRYKISKSLEQQTPDYFHDSRTQATTFVDRKKILMIEDSTLIRLVVSILDINDNAPQFTTKIFTGGLTTSTGFGTEIMKVSATDADEGENGIIQYYRSGEIHKTLAEGLDDVNNEPFLVDQDTGMIILNFYPQKVMKGYFDFIVLANDTHGFQDIAHVFIYLLREDQRVRFVLRQHPTEVQSRILEFRNTLSTVTEAIVNVDDFKIHKNQDGSFDKTKTDLFLHLVNRKDNSILEVPEVLKIIDQNIEVLDQLFKEFNVLDTQAAEALPFVNDFGPQPIFMYLVVSNLLIGALLIVVLTMCATQRSNYKRLLRAAKVNAFVTTPHEINSKIMPRVPNTNMHSQEGSNPMWLRNTAAYGNNWFKHDDQFENKSGDFGTLDSIDENVIAAEEYYAKREQESFFKKCNLYQQIDKLHAKHLETTEL